MFRSKIVFFVFASCFIAQTCFALSGVPSLTLSEATSAYTLPGSPTLLVVPNGGGSRFTEAHDATGAMVDVTITMVLRDPLGYPIANFPFEDIWLEAADEGLVRCIGGTNPDSNTDLNGTTQWVDPLFGGGHSEGPIQVFVNGSALLGTPGLSLKVNSPDINGDLDVDLLDAPIFAFDYYNEYTFQSDLNGDGVINLSDIPYFAQHFGAECP